MAAVIAAAEPFRGLIILPTGGGKTEVFLNALLPLVQSRHALTEPTNVVLVYPRIALANEQLNRFKKTYGGITFFQFHSGDVVQQDKFEAEELKRLKLGGTNVDTFETQLENSGVNLRFIFTTYHSFAKIAHLGNIFIFDEAHNLVANTTFGKGLGLLPPDAKCFFFTATPAKKGIMDMGSADGDEIIEGSPEFGSCLARVLPIDLISRGYIVAPKLLEAAITTKGKLKKNADDTILNLHEVSARVFAEQARRVRTMSGGRIVPKLMVAAKGTKHFGEIHKKLADIRTMSGESNINVYTVTAGSARKNGGFWKSREALIQDFNNNTNPSLIVHYDTLAEGIDVAGLTGVLILRRLSKIKFLQTVGRALRPYAILDFDENGEPLPLEQRAKKHAFVSIPRVNDDDEWVRLAQRYAKALTNYGELREILSDTEFADNGEEDDDDDDFYDGNMKKPSWIDTMISNERHFEALERFFA